MSSPSPDRKGLEELWSQRLNDAKLRLDFARNYLKEVVQDFSPKEISNSDGHFAYQKAVRAENSALKEYARLMRIYHDLTVNGIIPDESEWHRRRAEGSEGNSNESEQTAG